MSAPLWLLTLITFSGTLAMHIFVPALPEAARDLGASIGEMQLTMSVYIFGLAVDSSPTVRCRIVMAGGRCWSAGSRSTPWPASPPASSATCIT